MASFKPGVIGMVVRKGPAHLIFAALNGVTFGRAYRIILREGL